jgi:hypothetical protein
VLSKALVLQWAPKLSCGEPSQYLDGRPTDNNRTYNPMLNSETTLSWSLRPISEPPTFSLSFFQFLTKTRSLSLKWSKDLPVETEKPGQDTLVWLLFALHSWVVGNLTRNLDHGLLEPNGRQQLALSRCGVAQPRRETPQTIHLSHKTCKIPKINLLWVWWPKAKHERGKKSFKFFYTFDNAREWWGLHREKRSFIHNLHKDRWNFAE